MKVFCQGRHWVWALTIYHVKEETLIGCINGNYLIIAVYRENKGPFFHDNEVVVNYKEFFELQVVQMSGS